MSEAQRKSEPWQQGVNPGSKHWVTPNDGRVKPINAGNAETATLIVRAVNDYLGHSWMGDNTRDMIEGMSVSVDVSTGDHDSGNRFMGTVTEVMDDPTDKHGVTLLVQDAKPNFSYDHNHERSVYIRFVKDRMPDASPDERQAAWEAWEWRAQLAKGYGTQASA